MRTSRFAMILFFMTMGCKSPDPLDLENVPHQQCALNGEYFPVSALLHTGRATGVDQSGAFMQRWYEDELRALHSPSLYVCGKALQGKAYRLFWARSLSSRPVAELRIQNNGSAVLTTKVLNRRWSPKQVELQPELVQKTTVLTSAQSVQALELLEQVGWQDASAQILGRDSLDGADWVFEERDGDRYQFADFREPAPRIRELTRLVFWKWSHLLPSDDERSVAGY